MPSPASHLPDDGSDMARRLLDLEARLLRLEAARRLQQVGVTGGTLIDAHGGTPVLTLTSGDIGPGAVRVQLQGVSRDGAIPAALALAFPGAGMLTIDTSGAGWGSWQALTLTNGWTAAGGSWRTPQVRRLIDGTVQLTGEIAPGTLTAGTTLCTLAGGMRPAADTTLRVPGGTAGSTADLTVTASGAVILQSTTGTITRLGLTTRFPL
ncbi:hypothetical protein [Kitasatospora sp. NPDC058478]|uniref:hypothetical protein n=1 Tax=unclassified Kitasatospora TaxID=2633591 RepID=UPI003650BC80